MAITLADARTIAARVARSPRVYQMGFNRRWAPAYRYLRRQIDSGFVPSSANVKMNDGDMLTPSWYTDTAVSGGFMYDTAVHLVDMIAWLVGPVESVAALGRKTCYPDYDDIAMLLRCRGGRPVAFTTCGHASWGEPTERVELYGDHALAASEDLDRVRLTTREDPHAAWQRLPSAGPLDLWGIVQEDRAFIAGACVRKLGIEPPAVLDQFGNATEKAYTAWPDRLYVIDAAGRVAYKSRPGPFGFKAGELRDALGRIVPR
jgi:myo-inositol 2-dehydrogenase/D-chiro-inositol 1-dehydrogenase